MLHQGSSGPLAGHNPCRLPLFARGVLERALIVHIGVLLTTFDIVMRLLDDVSGSRLHTLGFRLAVNLIALVRQVWIGAGILGVCGT